MSFDRIDDRISDRIEIEKRKRTSQITMWKERNKQRKKIHDGNERKDIQHWQE